MAGVKKDRAFVDAQANVGPMREPTDQERAAWKAQAGQGLQTGPGLAAQSDPHVFVQFSGQVVVHDSRGLEQLTDRAVVGQPFGPYGHKVNVMFLVGDWFEIWTEGAAMPCRVPLTNVRSAHR